MPKTKLPKSKCKFCEAEFFPQGMAQHLKFKHPIESGSVRREVVQKARKPKEQTTLEEAILALEVKRDSISEVIQQLKEML